MSLSSVIREPEVRERLRETVKPRARMPSQELLAPPITSNYAIVGIAFDYLFRFGLQRLNHRAQTGRWIADSGLEALQASDGLTPEVDIENFERSRGRQFAKER